MTATVVSIDEANARRRQERIRLMASTVREGIDKIGSLVEEAKASNDHVALGYASWTAYLADTLGAEPLRLDRGKRREVVALLSGEGMSTRDIAAVVGAGNATVHRDIVATVSSGTVERPALVVSHDGRERPSTREPADVPPFDPITGELLDDAEVVELERPKPALAKPRRAPLPDSFFRATFDLCRKAESLTRLVEDDRFPQNASKVATANRSDLVRAIDALQRVIDRLPEA